MKPASWPARRGGISFSPVQYLVELAGVALFAISGVLAARRKGFDIFGAAVIAIVCSIGGGTSRDVLLDRHPIFWIADPTYIWVILGATTVSLFGNRLWIATRRPLLIVDGLGLAFFTIGGARIAEDAGHPATVAALMGLLTGIAGGTIRDVLSNEVPMILRPGRLYATAALAGAALYLVLEAFGVPRSSAAWAGMVLIAVIRFAAIRWDLGLPVVALEEPGREKP